MDLVIAIYCFGAAIGLLCGFLFGFVTWKGPFAKRIRYGITRGVLMGLWWPFFAMVSPLFIIDSRIAKKRSISNAERQLIEDVLRKRTGSPIIGLERLKSGEIIIRTAVAGARGGDLWTVRCVNGSWEVDETPGSWSS